jgi:hypothetical protein
MNERKNKFGAQQLGELVPHLLDDVFQKRAGLNTALIGAWPEIVGDALSRHCQPGKIAWSRANSVDNAYAPATLHIAVEPIAALRIQHETTTIIARINTFFGYAAIDRIKVTQRPTATLEKRSALEPISEQDIARANELTATVEDEGLRRALAKLGAGVVASQRGKRSVERR